MMDGLVALQETFSDQPSGNCRCRIWWLVGAPSFAGGNDLFRGLCPEWTFAQYPLPGVGTPSFLQILAKATLEMPNLGAMVMSGSAQTISYRSSLWIGSLLPTVHLFSLRAHYWQSTGGQMALLAGLFPPQCTSLSLQCGKGER